MKEKDQPFITNTNDERKNCIYFREMFNEWNKRENWMKNEGRRIIHFLR